MPHFARQLAASEACTPDGFGVLEYTALSPTGDRAEPVVSTSIFLDYSNLVNYQYLVQLLRRVKRDVEKIHPGLPDVNPLALWVHQLCIRRTHAPEKYTSQTGDPRLERVMAFMLPQMQDSEPRDVRNACIDQDTGVGFAELEDPHGWRERLGGVGCLHVPLTVDERAGFKISQVYKIADIGRVGLYGVVQKLGAAQRPVPQIVQPSLLPTWKIK